MTEEHTIVFVNDHADTVDMFISALEMDGFKVEGFTDPGLGLQRVTSAPEPCLVIVDYRIGPMDGDEFIRRMRAAGGSTPVVVLTGEDPSTLNYGELKTLGVALVLSKPIRIEDAEEIVRVHGRGSCGATPTSSSP